MTSSDLEAASVIEAIGTFRQIFMFLPYQHSITKATLRNAIGEETLKEVEFLLMAQEIRSAPRRSEDQFMPVDKVFELFHKVALLRTGGISEAHILQEYFRSGGH